MSSPPYLDTSGPAARLPAVGRPVAATLAVVCLVLGADTALYGAIAPLLPELSDRFDLSKAGAGVLVAAYALGMVAGALPLGLAAARFGGRATLLGGVALLACASVGFGLAGSAALLTAARCAQGVGGAAIWSGGMTWLTGIAPERHRGAVIGAALGAALAGQVAGPALGAAAVAVGAATVFATFAIVVLGVGLLAARLPAGVPAARGGVLRRAPGARRSTAVFGVGLLVPSMTFGALELLMPLRLHALGVRDTAIGAIFVGLSLATAVASPWVGRWSDRRGPLSPLCCGVAAAMVLAPALGQTSSAAAYAAVGLLLWLAIVTSWTPSIAQLSGLAERSGSSPGVVWGVVNLAFAGGTLVGTAGGGVIAQWLGDAAVLWVAAALLAGTLAIALPHGARPRPS
jgi:predicted MFS family arabinose efflux permease